MKNLGNMLKQAQQMQSRMAEMQGKLAEIEVSGQAGAGCFCTPRDHGQADASSTRNTASHTTTATAGPAPQTP